jgi:hypothetical protein
LFLMPNVLRLLQHYDEKVPYAISDWLWYMSQRAPPAAPRCLPCHFRDAGLSSVMSRCGGAGERPVEAATGQGL